MKPYAELLRRAKARRAFDADTTAYRLFHGEAEGAPGINVDWYQGVAVLSLLEELAAAEETALLDALETVARPEAIYLKRRPKEARVVANTQRGEVAPELPVRGQPVAERTVRESGLSFLIRPGQGLSVGLYLDAREARASVRKGAEGKTLLNCFAYTCGFGVAALAGGAVRAVNLDVSRRVLDWGVENTRLNGFTPNARDFIAGDTFDWLKRFAKKGETFDVVLLDPPSFATTRASRFSAASDYPKLVAAAAPVVAQGGRLVACCNLATLPMARFHALVERGLADAKRKGEVISSSGASPVDFPAPAGGASALKVVVLGLSPMGRPTP